MFKTHGLDAVTRGCLGGTGFCFISHKGIVQPCGFLQLNCGDITKTSFADIWKNSEIFLLLRDANNLKGKCGKCELKNPAASCEECARCCSSKRYAKAAEQELMKQPKTFWLKNRFVITNQALSAKFESFAQPPFCSILVIARSK